MSLFPPIVLSGTRGERFLSRLPCRVRVWPADKASPREFRLGWTGDIQVFTPTASYMYDVAGILQGWLKDVRAEQLKDNDGIVPWVVPNILPAAPLPLAIWADVSILTPLDLYRAYGDASILSDSLESMEVWLNKGVVRDEKTGLWTRDSAQLGDWLNPKASPHSPAMGDTDTHLVADAYLVRVTEAMAEVSRVIGTEEEVQRYMADHQRLRKAFRQEYVTPNGRLMSDSPCAILLALRFKLIDDKEHIAGLKKRLEWHIRKDVFRVATGFAGTPIILNTLAENEMLHFAYRMLQEKANPSWLYPVSMGATTIWERWDSMLPDGSINPGQMTSFNHYALGSVADFLHTVVGGLSSLEAGWKRALIAPQPGGTFTRACTSHISPYGKYESSWKIEQGRLHLTASVPPNASAEIKLPGLLKTVGSGNHRFEVEWIGDKRWPPKGIHLPCTPPIIDRFV